MALDWQPHTRCAELCVPVLMCQGLREPGTVFAEEGSVMFTIVSRNIVDDKQLYLVLGRESMRVRAFVFVCGGVRSQIDEDVVCSL